LTNDAATGRLITHKEVAPVVAKERSSQRSVLQGGPGKVAFIPTGDTATGRRIANKEVASVVAKEGSSQRLVLQGRSSKQALI
jgi:hypothetical protein